MFFGPPSKFALANLFKLGSISTSCWELKIFSNLFLSTLRIGSSKEMSVAKHFLVWIEYEANLIYERPMHINLPPPSAFHCVVNVASIIRLPPHPDTQLRYKDLVC